MKVEKLLTKQVNKNILYMRKWWHIGLKDNGGVKSTETRFTGMRLGKMNYSIFTHSGISM